MIKTPYKFKGKLKPGGKFILLAAVLAAFLIPMNAQSLVNVSAATGAQVNVAVDYQEETARISAGPGGSKKFYISLDKGKNWEGISAASIDISVFYSTKEAELYFKGDQDTATKVVKLMAEPSAPTVKYIISGGIGSISCPSASGTMEYRKGTNGVWKTAVNGMTTSLYEIKGATLYYRTAATPTSRPSKMATVRIPKRPSAPSVKLDGSKLLLTGFKPGETQYRINTAEDWTTFPATNPKAKTISLYYLFANNNVSNNTLPAGTIEFRTRGSDQKVTSASKVIEIPAQITCLDTAVTLNGTTLIISDPTPKRQYEYTKLLPGASFNPETAKWISVSSKKSVIIPKAAINDRILVRIKASTDSSTRQVVPASTYVMKTVESITTKK